MEAIALVNMGSIGVCNADNQGRREGQLCFMLSVAVWHIWIVNQLLLVMEAVGLMS